MTQRCHLCGKPIEGAWATVTFAGFETLALNGVSFVVGADCLRFAAPDRGIVLPELVHVEQEDVGWVARCLEHGAVAMKDVRDDAELGAARHLARMHVEFVA